MSESKIFGDWYEVDCNDCAHYWDNSCDGSCKAQKRPCNSFIATRSIVIPEQIKSLQKSILSLRIALATLAVISAIGIMIGVVL